MKRSTIVTLVVLTVLILDQALKIYVKTSIPYRGGFDILGLEWAKIHFIENDGMAFGISFGGVIGKYILSIFRILMVGFLFYLISGIIKAMERKGVIICFALIVAGAIGNIIDSAFYGLIFSESTYHGGLAEMFPEGGGYAGFLQGWVVDMFYFPLIDTRLPDWLPFWGGRPFLFFKPVFNVADSAISIGVVGIILFYRDLFKEDKKSDEDKTDPDTAQVDATLEDGE